MGKGLENYIPVAVRLEKARSEHNDLVITTDVTAIDLEKECALVKATILVGEKVKATAHALSTDLSENKALEKAESAAIGRALANMGYPGDDGVESSDDEDDSDEKSEKKSSKKSGLGGLGKKKAKKKEEEEEDESEDEDEEDSDEDESDEEESEDEEEDEEEESDEDESEEKEEKSSKKSAAGPSKLSGVMAKYGLKKS